MNKNAFRMSMGAVAVSAALLLAACSSGGSTPSGSSSSSVTLPTTYSGVESKGIPSKIDEPKKVPGFTFTVGFINALASVSSLTLQQTAAQKEVESLGGTFVAKDSQGSVNTQTSVFDQLLNQGVDAIIMQPIDPKAIAPDLAQAKAKGIHVITVSAPATASEPNLDGVTSNFLYGADELAWVQALDAAMEAPGGTFGIVGTALPSAATTYTTTRQKYWAEKFGLKYVGTQLNAQETQAAAAQSAGTLITQHPDIKVIFGYNDPTAEGIVAAIRSAGKKGILAYGSGGEDAAIKLVKSGDLAGDAEADAAAMGKAMAQDAYIALTDKSATLPKTVLIPGKFHTPRGDFASVGPLKK